MQRETGNGEMNRRKSEAFRPWKSFKPGILSYRKALLREKILQKTQNVVILQWLLAVFWASNPPQNANGCSREWNKVKQFKSIPLGFILRFGFAMAQLEVGLGIAHSSESSAHSAEGSAHSAEGSAHSAEGSAHLA